jgi:hypothetical protein
MMMHRFGALLLSLAAAATQGFVPKHKSPITMHYYGSTLGRFMAKFDGEKWVPESDAEKSESGYSIVGTLLRHGPVPAFRRVLQPQDYEQAVLKFMVQEKCDRDVAQGNMDAYTRNPNDWLAMRLREEKSGIKTDFVTLQPKEIGLRLLWIVIVLYFSGRAVTLIAHGGIDIVSGA